MAEQKAIGLIFIEKFADWEFGMLAASAVEWFGVRAVALTPEARPVKSIAGFTLAGERDFSLQANEDLDAVAVIGSENWAGTDAPDPAPLLKAVADRGGTVGGICAGTLALARADLFEGRGHTSNGREWILEHLPDYAGKESYQDVSHAVSDSGVVSAPGSAPGTFAVRILESLYPEKQETLAQMREIFAREHKVA